MNSRPLQVILAVAFAAAQSCEKQQSLVDSSQTEVALEGVALNDYAQAVRDDVELHGFHVTYVGAGEGPSFGYSTGIMETFGIPEVIVSSLPPSLTHELVTQYVNRFKEVGPPLGERVKAVEERFDFYLIPAADDLIGDRVLAAREFYRERPFKFLQIVYPDTAMKFPDEEGYDYDQELFGVFPAPDNKVMSKPLR